MSEINSGGDVFLSLLSVAFIVLKLTGVITWSWWLVTLPIWGGIVLFFIGLLLFLILKAIGKKL